MLTPTQRLYLFLTACRGNWRNTIHIAEPESGQGYLMAFDGDARPVIMSVEQLHRYSGQQIDPAECLGRLSEGAFSEIYALWLCWQFPAPQKHILRRLCRLQHLASFLERRQSAHETS